MLPTWLTWHSIRLSCTDIGWNQIRHWHCILIPYFHFLCYLSFLIKCYLCTISFLIRDLFPLLFIVYILCHCFDFSSSHLPSSNEIPRNSYGHSKVGSNTNNGVLKRWAVKNIWGQTHVHLTWGGRPRSDPRITQNLNWASGPWPMPHLSYSNCPTSILFFSSLVERDLKKSFF